MLRIGFLWFLERVLFVGDAALNRFIHACIPGIWTATDHVACGCLNPSLRGTGDDNRTGGRSPEKTRGRRLFKSSSPKQAATPAENA